MMAKATDTKIPVMRPVISTAKVVTRLTMPEAGRVRNILMTSLRLNRLIPAAMMITARATTGTFWRILVK